MLSMPRAGVLYLPHHLHRCHKKHVPSYDVSLFTESGDSASQRLACGRVKSMFWDVPCHVHRAPRKCEKIHPVTGSMHFGNVARRAHTVFPPDAINRDGRRGKKCPFIPEESSGIRRNSNAKAYDFSPLYSHYFLLRAERDAWSGVLSDKPDGQT